MANTAAQFGFQHIGFLPGYAPDFQLSRRLIQSSYASAVFFGDPMVKSAASIYVSLAVSSSVATAIAGIFQGCSYIPKGGGAPIFAPWFPGSVQADATALLLSAPGAIFKVAALLTTIPATAVGQNISFSTGAGGTTVGAGFSTYVVDQASLTTASTAPFTIVDMWSNVGAGNGADNTTNFNWVIVTPNNAQFRAGQTGVA